jgi:hypothetical protein
MPYAVELNGRLMQCRRGRLEPLSDIGRIRGDCRVVTDFQDAITRTMTVEADTRYVELMISRKLQESGEFDEPVSVITHWKRRRGRNVSEVFFTALPSRQYFHCMEQVAEHSDHVVVLPLQAVLLTALHKVAGREPAAVVIQHGRFADMIIGARSKVWYANRAVAFDDSEEQIQALWETIRADIDTVGSEHHQKVGRVYIADWIDSGSLPGWTDADAPQLIPLEKQPLTVSGQQREVSLPSLIHAVPMRHAVASGMDRLFLGARRVLPYLNVALLLGALLLGGTGLWCRSQCGLIAGQIDKMQRTVETIAQRAPSSVGPVVYKPTLEFLQNLWRSWSFPTYGRLLSDIGQGADGDLTIETVDASYTHSKLEIKLFGRAEGPFESAHTHFHTLQDRLRKRGYVILEERFDTRINTSNFLIHFVKEV